MDLAVRHQVQGHPPITAVDGWTVHPRQVIKDEHVRNGGLLVSCLWVSDAQSPADLTSLSW